MVLPIGSNCWVLDSCLRGGGKRIKKLGSLRLLEETPPWRDTAAFFQALRQRGDKERHARTEALCTTFLDGAGDPLAIRDPKIERAEESADPACPAVIPIVLCLLGIDIQPEPLAVRYDVKPKKNVKLRRIGRRMLNGGRWDGGNLSSEWQ